MASQFCMYSGCSNNKRTLPKLYSYYKFPVTDEERCDIWLEHCKNDELRFLAKEVLKNRVVCELHFNPSDFQLMKSRKWLVNNAVPHAPASGPPEQHKFPITEMEDRLNCEVDMDQDEPMEMEIDETVPNTSIIENTSFSTTLTTSLNSTVNVSTLDNSTDLNNSCQDKTIDDDDDVVILDDDNIIVEKEKEKVDIIDLVEKSKGGFNSKCINYACKGGDDFIKAPKFCLNFYRIKSSQKKKQEVCEECLNIALEHYDELATALRNGGNLMNCNIPIRNDLVEIDDSDSDEEVDEKEITYFNDESMEMLKENFDLVLEKVIANFKMNEHCDRSLQYLKQKGGEVKASYTEVDTMLSDVRKQLDTIHRDLYAEFQVKYDVVPPLIIDDAVPQVQSNKPHPTKAIPMQVKNAMGQSRVLPSSQKQQLSLAPSANAPGLERERRSLRKSKQISYAELDDPHSSNSNSPIVVDTGLREPREIEAIQIPIVPPDLPQKGPIQKPPLVVGELYYSVSFVPMGSWVKVRLGEILNPGTFVNGQKLTQTMYYLTMENKISKYPLNRTVSGKEIAYSFPCNVMLDVGTRVIAVFREAPASGELKKGKKDVFYPGIIAEPLSYTNKYRYLIFFDDGYAQYVHHNMVHLIYDCSEKVWEDMHIDSRPFIKKYLESYPERPMVKLRKDVNVRTEYNGKWWLATVMNIDCSLVQMYFEVSNRVEWIYRGSTRLNPMFKEEQAASNRQNKSRIHRQFNETGPYVQYTRGDGNDQSPTKETETTRAVARKSTSRAIIPQINNGKMPVTVPFLPVVNEPQAIIQAPKVISKVVYFTPRAQANTKSLYVQHTCSVECKKYITYDVQKLKGYNPLSKPLLCGWNRVTYKHKGKRDINYKAPCGLFLRNMAELHRYLRMTKSEMTVDLFDFDFWVHCLAEFVLERNSTINKDMSNGLENVAIPVVNYVDNEKNTFTNYSNVREPQEGVHLNLDEEFLCGCDCEDDCQDKSKCNCWQLTLAGLRFMNKGPNSDGVGYVHRRLPEPVYTGIYECNSRCKCAKTCLNRVVQNPLQFKLQVFKTINRGWGIRCLNDIPQGAFICIYAGKILTEEVANQGGQHFGDEYLAELDYIEVVEKMKEDYEEDVKDDDDDDDMDDGKSQESGDEEEVDNYLTSVRRKGGIYDDTDFIPPVIVTKGKISNPSYKTRSKRHDNDKGEKRKGNDDDDDTVTISDDEDVIREPSSFNPKTDVDDESKPSKYLSVREMYDRDECVYIMDAKVRGNIGRYLNHSCSPNVFVQNVFVDTHDLRFPWVAFFALSYIRAGTELTWNYNYDVGSVPGKTMYCHCGSQECRGRLL